MVAGFCRFDLLLPMHPYKGHRKARPLARLLAAFSASVLPRSLVEVMRRLLDRLPKAWPRDPIADDAKLDFLTGDAVKTVIPPIGV
jgi:hypothetical protein